MAPKMIEAGSKGPTIEPAQISQEICSGVGERPAGGEDYPGREIGAGGSENAGMSSVSP